ncbi:MAG: hypothetical protein V3S31_03330 [Dehalococcoidia bacterium]
MYVLRLSLIGAALACAYVGWASWSAGYTPEVAMVRALVAFMVVSFVGYLAEMVVASQPPRLAAAAGVTDEQGGEVASAVQLLPIDFASEAQARGAAPAGDSGDSGADDDDERLAA